MQLRFTRILATALACLVALLIVLPLANAQGVTGTINGTVKDGSGGVVPGATVTLISESQGTTSTPVITSERGDFVFPNITADTYTVQVEMPAFKTPTCGGRGQPGLEHPSRAITLEIGGTSEIVDVNAETAPSGPDRDRRKVFHDHPEQAAALPLNNRSYVALLVLAPGVNVDPNSLASQLDTGSGDANRADVAYRRRRRRQLHGGRRDHDGPGGQPPPRASAPSDLRGQGRHVRLPGRVRPRQRPADQRRHQERNEPVPRLLLRRRAPLSFGYANSKTNILNGDPEAVRRPARLGWAIGGPIGKPGGNNKLFFYYNQEFNPRITATGLPFPHAHRARAQGDFSQSTDNLGNPFPLHQGPRRSQAPAPRRVRRPVSTTAACWEDSGKPALADRLEHPEVVADAELPAGLPTTGQSGLQLREHLPVGEPARLGAGRPP